VPTLISGVRHHSIFLLASNLVSGVLGRDGEWEGAMTTSNAVANSIRPAPMWQRILAAATDLIIVSGCFYYAANRWGTTLPDGTRGWNGLAAAAVFCLLGAYWVIPEWLFGSTIGKFIFQLRVKSVSNGRGSFIQSLKRNLLRPIDFIVLYLIGFVVAMLNPLRQRLGDQWAHTIVVSSGRTLIS
jgi:uncharacterized RDD family membrane protein YckC